MAEVLDVQDMLPSPWEGKRNYRWILAIEGVDAFLLKSAARPTVNFEEVAIHWINGIRYLAGKPAFETMTITLHDPIAPSATQQVMEWIRLCHEHVSQRGGYADFYKRDLQLKMLDPMGAVVEHWDVKGAWVQNANWGELAYDDQEVATVTCVIRYDLAVAQF